MQSPFFSIVIPTYNRANFISKTIQSLLNQTYQNFEIIVVDDESTDDTEAVVTSIKDSRIKYFKKDNAERGAARNYGVKKALGRYINFFDSDDLAYPNHLQSAYDFIAHNKNIEVFHQNYDEQDVKGNRTSEPTKIYDINKQIVEGNLLAVMGVFVRTDVAIENPFCEIRELSGSEDYHLWLHLCSRYTFYNNSPITTTVIYHPNNSTINFSKEELIKRKQLMIRLIKEDEVSASYYKGKLKKLEANTDLYVALHILLAKERKGAIEFALRAIKKSPKLIFTKRFVVVLSYLLGVRT